MAEIGLNRARLATAPQNLPFVKSNTQSQILGSGVVATAPLVALAYSFAVLEFDGNSTHAGDKIAVTCNGNTINVTLNADGHAEVSLLPFIRTMALDSLVLDNPLYCDSGAIFQQNNFRGYIDVTITETGRTPITMRVNYIFGNYSPRGEEVTDLYFDYFPEGETWCNVDAASHYDANGVPVEFEDNWCNVNEIVDAEPTGDFALPIEVAWYYGIDDIVFKVVNYHFHYDCRVDDILKVRWLDNNGNINVRKFGVSGRSHGATIGNTWQRPHTHKEISLGYDRGKDEWGAMTANETITIGDDCIPTTHYDWVRALASSAVVEVFIKGTWTRCNLGDVTIECDPRKATFNASFSLVLPTDNVQEF